MVYGRVSSYLRRQHLALVVVFLVLTGGSAYALDGSDTVFTDDIVDGEVKSIDIVDQGVGAVDVADDTLAGGGLGAIDLAPGSVGSSEILTNSVRTGAVRDDVLPGGGLTEADLAPASVGASELADQAWTGSEINEAGLATVPAAVIAGKGRSSSRHENCVAPEGAAYVTCASVALATGRTARLLMVATGTFRGWKAAHCRFRIPPYVSGGVLVGPYVTSTAQIKNDNFLLTRTLPASPGSMSVQLECVSDYVYQAVYDDLHLSVVGLALP